MENKLLVYYTLLIYCTSVNGNFGTPGSGQYHIQTDEGPERFFKFQTDNGQFRKEKRLQDGTVIGTDAWIDGFGYLRQKDYIADSKGYRILKSKTFFVGTNRSIEDAMNEAKNAPPQSGILVKNSIPRVVQRPLKYTPPSYYTTTTKPPIYSTTASPINSIHVSTIKPSIYSRNHYIQRPSAVVIKTPSIETTYIPTGNDYSTSTISPKKYYSLPSTTLAPPLEHHISSSTPITPITLEPVSYQSPISHYSTTPIAVTSNYNSPISDFPSSVEITPKPFYRTVLSQSLIQNLNDELQPNKLDDYDTDYKNRVFTPTSYRPPVGIYNKPNKDPIESSTAKAIIASYRNNNNNIDTTNERYYDQPTYDKHSYPKRSWDSYYNQIEDLPPNPNEYDGIGLTNNGFQYYLPRHYHEEENSDSNQRQGSYGYIDPFGIRRVVYYNTSPERGFVHRKNNRYVGFNAAPYDPNPA